MDNDHHQPMRAALEQARLALAAGEFPVGCVITHRGRIVAAGRRQHSRDGSELDHAEIVTMRALLSDPSCPPPAELVVYATMEPCLMCYATLLLNGFRTIVYAYEDAMGGGTGLNLQALPQLYREMAVDVIAGVCRDESLALFQSFFSDPNNDYWRGSPLASYTLAQ